jgi:hypothetical protein
MSQAPLGSCWLGRPSRFERKKRKIYGVKNCNAMRDETGAKLFSVGPNDLLACGWRCYLLPPLSLFLSLSLSLSLFLSLSLSLSLSFFLSLSISLSLSFSLSLSLSLSPADAN